MKVVLDEEDRSPEDGQHYPDVKARIMERVAVELGAVSGSASRSAEKSGYR